MPEAAAYNASVWSLHPVIIPQSAKTGSPAIAAKRSSWAEANDVVPCRHNPVFHLRQQPMGPRIRCVYHMGSGDVSARSLHQQLTISLGHLRDLGVSVQLYTAVLSFAQN